MKSPQHKLQALVFGVCALYFLAVGGYKASHYSPDFMPVYTGSRCLLHGCNPYDIPQLQQQYFLAGGLARQLPKWKNEPPVYPPSTFLVVSPLTFLSWPAARTLWGVMNGLLLIAAAVLIVGVCPCSYRWLATVLASLAFLMSASNILALGQPATFAIALLAIGVILFVQGRYLPLAAVLMTLSLAVKPQIGGLIVLYFLVKRIHWRYATLAFAGAAVILLISVLLLHLNPAAMHWTSDLRENIARSVAPGAANDPRPAHRGGVDFANLQAITSIFFADPKMFNLAAYVIFLIALAVFIVATLKTDVNADSDRQIHYAAIASLSAISLLPVYHRVYDARVLLLAIPAIVVVHQRQRLLGMILAVVAIFQVLSMYTQGLVLSFFENRGEMPHLLQNKLLFLLTMRQGAYAVLILAVLLLSSMFFIGRSTSRPAES